ncbi:MAG: LPS biosynthesis glycosyltransferase [Leptolyngbyaceae cyanobacterium MO_188.B28]|nr:LPS biosynthesis glycosyltransferase [Leptolyngbyaceae cyanobacterium MO_188.B28]
METLLTLSRLTDHLGKTFILAYQEETQDLTNSLTQAGCDCEVLRQAHQPEYKTYSRSFLCLMNHQGAWRRALQADKPTLIVEADFVPVNNFSQLPPPYESSENLGIAWLYTCAPQIYSVSANGYAEGYSTSLVAYVITPQSAQNLLDHAATIETTKGPTAYSAWDSDIDSFLRDRGFRNYVPFRNYGEHGGLPNPEHHQNRLSKSHRADLLYGKLAFTPLYALSDGKKNRLKFLAIRCYARLKGIARLLLGKYLRGPVLASSENPIRLLKFALSRHFVRRYSSAGLRFPSNR